MGRDRAIPNKGDIQTFNGFDWVPLSVAGAILSAGSLSLVDSITSIVDEVDASKGFKVQAGTQNTGIVTTLDVGAQTAAYSISVPVLGGNDTIVTLATVQTVTGAKTFTGAVVMRDNAFTITDEADTTKTLVTSLGAMATGVDLIINAGAQTLDATLSIPVLLGNDTIVSLATVQTLTGAKTFSAALVAGSTLAVTGAATTAAITATSASGVTTLQAATQDAIQILGRAGGVGSFVGTITTTGLTASRIWTMPDVTTVVAGLSAFNLFTVEQIIEANLSVGSNATARVIATNGPTAGNTAGMHFQTAGANRWLLRMDGVADAGANTGSGLQINPRADDGSSIDLLLSVARAAGSVIQWSTARTSAFGPITASTGVFSSTLAVTGAATLTGAATFAAGATGTSPTLGLGYATGAGSAVTQITSRVTGVTQNTVCGQITLVSAAGSTAWQTFTVTNSTVAAGDVVRVVQKSGTDLYQIHVTAVAAGSFNITFATTGGTTVETPVFSFAILKAVAA